MTLVDLLRRRAVDQPDRRAYTFLLDGERSYVEFTYAALERAARRWAASFAQCARPGDRILLLLPPGLDLIAAFYGALYGGFIAVPANPPRGQRQISRLEALASNARPSVLAAASDALAGETAPALRSLAAAVLTPELVDATRDSAPSADDLVQLAGASPETVAMLQYTSGATAQPRGVALTHRNLVHNSQFIAERFEHGPDSRGVIWLPPYHDMGLIGGILQPLYVGFPVVLMSPMHVLQRPVRWLRAISDWHATTSGGPDFAYDLCVEKIGREDRAALDLGTWDVAFTGAEPVRAKTLGRFQQAFAPCGFKPEAWLPCYGLAEATLMVSGSAKSSTPQVLHVAASALEAGHVTPEPEGRAVVSCGSVAKDQQLYVVDPQTRRICPPGHVGEVWVSGPSVAPGYWDSPAESEETFAARLAAPAERRPGRADVPTDRLADPTVEATFMRTGDLGFVWDDELYLTGRCKELFIIAGRNHYPHDIEHTIEFAHPAIQARGCAAFSIEQSMCETLVAVAEVRRTARSGLTRPDDRRALSRAVLGAVASEHDIQVGDLVLVRPGSLPRTLSGKLQRGACRELYLRGSLRTI